MEGNNMKKVHAITSLFIILSLFATIATALEPTLLIDFSGDTAEENQLTIMGAAFGEYPAAAVTFGVIPTDYDFKEATDGRGAIINANPGEGVMILGQIIETDNAAVIRCNIRTSNANASVILASIGQDSSQFISTITPNNGAFFQDKYKRLSDFHIPPSTGFQPLIQIINTSTTENLTVFMDNLEIFTLDPDKYYSAKFLDGDESDPEIISMSLVEPTPTTIPTSTHTPTSTLTPIPTHTPTITQTFTPEPTFTPTQTYTQTPTVTQTPTYTPTPTPTLTPTPVGYAMLEFIGAVSSSDQGKAVGGAKITLSGGSIEDQVVYSGEFGFYTITVYGDIYDTYTLSVKTEDFNDFETLSNYNPNNPTTQNTNLRLQYDPGPTPTPTAIPSSTLIVKLEGMPDDAQSLDLLWVPPGSFTMGSPADDPDRRDDETQHQVTITRGFYLSKYEITQAQWHAVMGSNPSEFSGDDRPVEKVSWTDCQYFIDKLNALNMGTFRLPTEAEWEYAARAGSTSRFYWGDDPQLSTIDDYAWYEINSNNSTNNVGLLTPNAWGFHDILGNVFEWCNDWHAYYGEEAQTDPLGPETGTNRIRRGGSWLSYAQTCRTTTRGALTPFMRSQYLGLRILKEHP